MEMYCKVHGAQSNRENLIGRIQITNCFVYKLLNAIYQLEVFINISILYREHHYPGPGSRFVTTAYTFSVTTYKISTMMRLWSVFLSLSLITAACDGWLFSRNKGECRYMNINIIV